MRRALTGYATLIGPEQMKESATFTCGHCMSIRHVKPYCDPADLGGLCKICMTVICEKCVGLGCDPFEKKDRAAGGSGTCTALDGGMSANATGPAGMAPPPSSGVGTTWNPADKNATIVLSNGNLTADSTGFGGAYGAVRAIASKSSGKYYWEGYYSAGVIGANQVAGIGGATASLSNFIGNAQSCGVDGSGAITPNIGGGAIGVQAISDIISFAVDIDNLKIWFRKNGGIWDGSGTDNPATNTGGKSFSGIVSPPVFPMDSGGFGQAVFTANFGISAFSFSVPAGFTVGWPP